MCNKVMWLEKGKIVSFDKPEIVVDRYLEYVNTKKHKMKNNYILSSIYGKTSQSLAKLSSIDVNQIIKTYQKQKIKSSHDQIITFKVSSITIHIF